RRVEERLDLGELYDHVKLAGDLPAFHAEDGAVEVDVLAAGQLGVEAGADLQQAADAAGQLDLAARRLGDARQDLQERGFAGAVAADDAAAPACADLQAHVFQRPELGAPGTHAWPQQPIHRGAGQAYQVVAEGAVPVAPAGAGLLDAEALGQPVNANGN